MELRRLPNLPEIVDAMNVPSRGYHPNLLKSCVAKDFLDESGLLK